MNPNLKQKSKFQGRTHAPSEREPHWPTLDDNIDLSNAEAVTEWRGIRDCIPANSTGSLQHKHHKYNQVQ